MHQVKNLSIIVLGVLDVSFVDLLCLPLAIFHFDFSAGQRVLRILTAVTLLPLITVKQYTTKTALQVAKDPGSPSLM